MFLKISGATVRLTPWLRACKGNVITVLTHNRRTQKKYKAKRGPGWKDASGNPPIAKKQTIE